MSEELEYIMTEPYQKGYQQGRVDAIEEVINLLAKKEDTMLSDKQYYTIVELKKK